MAVQYLEALLSGTPFQDGHLLKNAKTLLKDKAGEYDALICTGISGIANAMVLSMKLKIPIVYVRKKSDRTHSTFSVEIPEKLANGIDHPLRVVFVDDTIDSGKTFNRIKMAVDTKGMQLVGLVLCNDLSLYTPSANLLFDSEINGKLFHNIESHNIES